MKSFCTNTEYGCELIPELNFFSKKMWLNEKVTKLKEENASVFIQKDRIIWAYLEEKENWLPIEKVKFYTQIFGKNDFYIVIEKKDNQEYYLAIAQGEFVAFSENYAVVKNELLQLCIESKVKIFGIGCVEEECDLKISIKQIQEQLHIENAQFDEEDILYVNEENENFEAKSSSEIDAIFYKWFELNLQKHSQWRKILIKSAYFGCAFFFILNYLLQMYL